MKLIFIIILIFLLMLFIRYSIRTEFNNNLEFKKDPTHIENYEYDNNPDIEDSFVDPTK